METRSRPVVASISVTDSVTTLSPQLQQMANEAPFNMLAVNPAEISAEISEELVQRIEGLVHYSGHCHIDAKLMDSFPNLKVISNFGVGVNHIDIAAASERGNRCLETHRECSLNVRQIWLSLFLMASARNVVEGDRIVRSPETKQFSHYYGTMVSGSTIGIVGLGRIGCAVAKRANGFDMKVLYYNRNRKGKLRRNNLAHSTAIRWRISYMSQTL
ncbi:hypothetical protein OS493_005470 [Desmophyllum pertusum]|uniref:Uncharacterized protein n=1 Tax=Desmophyllum pertusum TaxID=174260 RepID=A0A9W9YV12_9CNID|nr:hypothetical protein OS493_005470 [Desmophyllum pertusum]